MSVHVSVNLNGLNQMISGQSLKRAKYVLANQAMQDMDQFVPLKNKHLSDSAHLDNNYNIVYNTPYARAQFYGFITNYKTGKVSRIRNYTPTEGRSPSRRWDLRAKSLYGDAWANKVKKSLMEGK